MRHPHRRMKNIVVCCDGTGNEYGRNNTNVVEIFVLAEKDEGQVVYYDPGIGTGGWEYHEGSGKLRAMGDQATGHGLQRNSATVAESNSNASARCATPCPKGSRDSRGPRVSPRQVLPFAPPAIGWMEDPG